LYTARAPLETSPLRGAADHQTKVRRPASTVLAVTPPSKLEKETEEPPTKNPKTGTDIFTDDDNDEANEANEANEAKEAEAEAEADEANEQNEAIDEEGPAQRQGGARRARERGRE